MEVPYSPFVCHRLAELYADLCGDIDSSEVALLGCCGIQRGILPKPKARMDAYHVNRGGFNFATVTVDVPLKAHDIKEVKAVSVLSSSLQCFKQDYPVLSMVGPFWMRA